MRTAGIVTTVWYAASLVYWWYNWFRVSGHKQWQNLPLNYGHTGVEDVPMVPKIIPWQWEQPMRTPRFDEPICYEGPFGRYPYAGG